MYIGLVVTGGSVLSQFFVLVCPMCTCMHVHETGHAHTPVHAAQFIQVCINVHTQVCKISPYVDC